VSSLAIETTPANVSPATVTGALVFTFGPLVPVTVNLNVYVSAVVATFAGTVTFVFTLLFEQATETGSPAIVGVEENLQCVAAVTCAVNFTCPPAEGSDEGAALNDDTVASLVEAPARESGAKAAIPPTKRATIAPGARKRNPLDFATSPYATLAPLRNTPTLIAEGQRAQFPGTARKHYNYSDTGV
jgi:hypothetical protein